MVKTDLHRSSRYQVHPGVNGPAEAGGKILIIIISGQDITDRQGSEEYET